MTDEPNMTETAETSRGAGWRFLKIFGLMLFVGIGFYGLSMTIFGGGAGITIGLGILVVLPYGLGGLAALLLGLRGQNWGQSSLAVLGLIMLVLLIGGIFLREGVICIVLLAPIWATAALLGANTVFRSHKKIRENNTLSCSFFIALPFLVLMLDNYIPQATDRYTVTRKIEIDATAADVWPHLLTLDGLSDDDGRWNFTQSVLGVPRPASAIVVGTGPDAIRQARWGETISFEEHVTEWAENERLSWTYVFPNDSVQAYTDRHISPDGRHLKIESGAYLLENDGAGRMTLTLTTDYAATTPLNFYSAIWGEVILGDIQGNILAIVKDRVEGR